MIYGVCCTIHCTVPDCVQVEQTRCLWVFLSLRKQNSFNRVGIFQMLIAIPTCTPTYRVPIWANKPKEERGRWNQVTKLSTSLSLNLETWLPSYGKFTFDRVTKPLVNLITEFPSKFLFTFDIVVLYFDILIGPWFPNCFKYLIDHACARMITWSPCLVSHCRRHNGPSKLKIFNSRVNTFSAVLVRFSSIFIKGKYICFW